MKITTQKILLEHPHVVLVDIDGQDYVVTLTNSHVEKYTPQTEPLNTLLYAEHHSRLYGHVVCENAACVAWLKALDGTHIYINGELSKETNLMLTRAAPSIYDALAEIMAKVFPFSKTTETTRWFLPNGTPSAERIQTRPFSTLEEVESVLAEMQQDLHLLKRCVRLRNQITANIDDVRKLDSLFPEETGLEFHLGNETLIKGKPSTFNVRNDIMRLLETHSEGRIRAGANIPVDALRELLVTPELLAKIQTVVMFHKTEVEPKTHTVTGLTEYLAQGAAELRMPPPPEMNHAFIPQGIFGGAPRVPPLDPFWVRPNWLRPDTAILDDHTATEPDEEPNHD